MKKAGSKERQRITHGAEIAPHEDAMAASIKINPHIKIDRGTKAYQKVEAHILKKYGVNFAGEGVWATLSFAARKSAVYAKIEAIGKFSGKTDTKSLRIIEQSMEEIPRA